MRRLGVFAIFVLFVAFALGAAAMHGLDRYRWPGPLVEETQLVIPRGVSLEQIADLLAEEGVIEHPLLFRAIIRIKGLSRGLKAGEYAFGPAISMEQVAAVLQSGEVVVHRLTIPEGLTSAEILALVAAEPTLDGEAGPVPAEGAVLPNTYHFTRGEQRAAIIVRMTEAMTNALADLWPQRAKDLPLKSPEEALILASIVEKETAVPEERGLVAGVFVNRLRKGMRLQSDPTVVYGLSGGTGSLGRALLRDDLKKDSPYNTYKISGLPPGPIANPGLASLQAVLNPEETEYFYFVADGTGGHAFAKTLKEHNRNVAKWRKHQKQQNAN